MGWQSLARQDGQPIALAGLWERFRWPNGTVTSSFAIITRNANEVVVGFTTG